MTFQELEEARSVGPNTFSINGKDVNDDILPDALATLREAVGYLESWEQGGLRGDEVRAFLRKWRSQKD